MSLENLKITDEQISQNGVTSAPDKLSGTAAENKAVFDRLVKNIVSKAVNAIITELTSVTGADSIGASTVEGENSSVQALLTSTSTLLKKTSKNFIAFEKNIGSSAGAQSVGALTLDGGSSNVQSMLSDSAVLLKNTSEALTTLGNLIKSADGAATVGAKNAEGESTNVQTVLTLIENTANEAVSDAAEAIRIAQQAVGGDLSDYVKKTDLATVDGEAGLVKLSSTSGVTERGDGTLALYSANSDEIEMRLGEKAITVQNFDRAVKSAMTNEKYRSALSDAEKALAQAWLGIDTSGGPNISLSTQSHILRVGNWSEYSNVTGVTWGDMDAISLGYFPRTKSLKVLFVDIATNATLEQRKAAEEACIYADYSYMEPADETVYDYLVYIGITSESKPTVDIPITVTAIFEG